MEKNQPKSNEKKTLENSKTEEEIKVKSKSNYKKKKSRKHITKGKAYILATYNNTIVTLTDQNGNVIASSSAGKLGFKGAKKSTPYAAGEIVKNVAEKVKGTGLTDIDVFVKGIGSGRESAVRALNASGFNIFQIKDTTPMPHNGCRPKKPRRV